MSNANDTDEGDEEAEIRTLLIHPYAWAVDPNAQDALKTLLEYWDGSFQEVEEIQLTRIRGELNKATVFGHVEAEEILEHELVRIDGDDLATLKNHVDEADLLADRLLSESERVDPDDVDDDADEETEGE